MPLKVEKVALWSGEIEDKPGALAKVLEPLAQAGVDLQVVLAERNPAKVVSASSILVLSRAGRQRMLPRLRVFPKRPLPLSFALKGRTSRDWGT